MKGSHSVSRATSFDSVWTIPNAISALRLVLIIAFALLLIKGHDAWAIGVLVVAGVSDFLDGYLARRWNQVTRIGQILDPAADRALTVAVVVGLAARSIIPWWLVAVFLARDLVVGVALLIAKRRGVGSPRVTRIGKVATFALYFFLPLAYLAHDRWDGIHTLAIWGAALTGVVYWIAGLGYVRDIGLRLGPPTARTAADL